MVDVTRILNQLDGGDPHAAEQLLPLVYEELRKLAASKLAQEKPGQTLQATALVHEAYLRMVGSETQRTYRDRGHFFASAAAAMRRILVDNLIVHDVHPSGKVLLSTETNMQYLVTNLEARIGEREVLSLEMAFPAAVSQDGRSLLFTDESLIEGPNYSVYYQSAPEANSIRLGEGTGLDLAPDGNSALVMVPTTPPRLMIYPVGAGASSDITVPGFLSYRKGCFFPDGKQLLISGASADQGSRCFVLELGNGTIRAMTPAGFENGRLSPDGLKLIAHKIGSGWFIFEISGENGTAVPALNATDEVIQWGSDGNSLLVLAARTVSPRIERFDLATGERTLVRLLAEGRPSVTSVWNAVISSNEQGYAYTYDRSLSVLYAVDGVH